MRKHKIKRIIFTALFAALTCTSTVAIRIPTPGTGGYVHPGDALVILSGIILGPLYGAIAAGVGSALSDLLGGYFIYAPATFLIKSAVAMVSGAARRSVRSRGNILPAALGGVSDIALVALGYFLYEIPFYGASAALVSMPANLAQGGFALVTAVMLCPIIMRIPDISRLYGEIHKK